MGCICHVREKATVEYRTTGMQELRLSADPLSLYYKSGKVFCSAPCWSRMDLISSDKHCMHGDDIGWL